MNSRERVLAAIAHRETDRVPIDCGAHRSSGISAIAYARLKKVLGIQSGDIYVYDMVQQLAIVEPPVLDRFGIDAIEYVNQMFMDKAEVVTAQSVRMCAPGEALIRNFFLAAHEASSGCALASPSPSPLPTSLLILSPSILSHCQGTSCRGGSRTCR